MRIIDCVQGSDEWFEAKRGIPSSSNFDKIVTSKGEPSKQAENYMYQLVAEYLSGKTVDAIEQNVWMQRGIKQEDSVRQEYTFITGNEVQQVGFCLSDDGTYGSSTDGLIEGGVIEIKVPKASTLIQYYLHGFPTTYFQQVQGEMLVVEVEFCDFIASHESMQPFIVRVERDEAFTKRLQEELVCFNQKLDEMKESLKEFKV